MNKSDLITFLVLAAGVGRRFGGELPKQYQTLAGHPVLWYSLKVLQDHPQVDAIVPVIAKDGQDLWQEVMVDEVAAFSKLKKPVPGGTERQFSVANGLASLNLDKNRWVAIHDGARPMLSRGLLDRLFAARNRGDALLAALQASDTIKQVAQDGLVKTTLNRDEIWMAQTPQMFRYGVIMEAHHQAAKAGFMGTDDVSLLEWLGKPVVAIAGESANMKITKAEDLPLAEFLLRANKES
ncbi:MAG: 2-C-methyl-D-erythritol 4-phosphate cytidylyltransferase [Magnetococcales bacterium]|nr:2-C-methyl-D-erythritol 4-phosphate cytidylyltransferase [Magnetococcales bacterium]